MSGCWKYQQHWETSLLRCFAGCATPGSPLWVEHRFVNPRKLNLAQCMPKFSKKCSGRLYLCVSIINCGIVLPPLAVVWSMALFLPMLCAPQRLWGGEWNWKSFLTDFPQLQSFMLSSKLSGPNFFFLAVSRSFQQVKQMFRKTGFGPYNRWFVMSFEESIC